MAMRPRGGGAGPSRLAGRTTTARPVYETFTPVFERQKEEEAEKLLIYLPGFLKENIRVSTEGKTTLKVRGERLIGANTWNRFMEEFQAPEDCNMGGIHARFENGILTITMPITKKIPPPATLVTTKQDETTQKPQIIPPQKTTQDDDHFPPLDPQSTAPVQPMPPIKSSSEEVDNFPPKISQPKPLKGDQDDDDDDDDFPTKTVRSSMKKPLKGDDQDEDSHKETTPPKAPFQPKPLNGTDGEDFPAKTFHRPMFLKDESPPKVAPLGDQKSLEAQEKVTGGGQKMKPLIGLKDFVQGEKSSEVKAKGIIIQTFDGRTGIDKDEQKVQSNKQTSIVSGGDLKEERQLVVNAGVAVLVILALGAHIYNTVGTRKSD